MAASLPGCLFIQFAREPVPGRVKTRMLPHLSPDEACALHSELVEWTSRALIDAGCGRVELAVAGNVEHSLFGRCKQLGVAAVYSQCGADLGERMHHAIAAGLARYERVVLVGSDCPGIGRDYLVRALAALDSAPLVLGPATDGGYVLIGARRIRRELFEGIPWGSATVYAETLKRLPGLGLDWVELPELSDIDRPADLSLWRAAKAPAAGLSAQ